MIELVGLKNCDSCRAASRWLDAEKIPYRFRDIRETPPSTKELKTWLAGVGSDRLINRRSTTWRKLSDNDRAKAETQQVVTLLNANPTLIKRPVIINGEQTMVGFDAATQAACRS